MLGSRLQPSPDGIESNRMLVFDVELGAGESKEVRYFNAIAADKTLALDLFEKGQRTFDDLLQHSEQIFNDLISCAFAPGNSEFSGHLLQLFTTDESLWKLYYSGFTCLLFARRASPDSVYGTTYITLGAVFFPP